MAFECPECGAPVESITTGVVRADSVPEDGAACWDGQTAYYHTPENAPLAEVPAGGR